MDLKEKTFPEKLKAAKAGDPEAQYYIGKRYWSGHGVEKSYEKAVEWYSKAAEQGHIQAQINLGSCYYNGTGVEQSYEKAVEWFVKAATQGADWAQNVLGNCYYLGKGIEQSHEKAVEWYKQSAAQGNVLAQKSLGNCYYKGEGVERSYESAVAWYEKAAAQGNSGAVYNLAICYHGGFGVDRNIQKALELYTKAAEAGETSAIEYLDSDKALNLYSEAAKEGYAEAQNALGVCYYYGLGGVCSDKNAAIWFRKAAEQNHPVAQSNLGACYFLGHGVEKDFKQAREWYKRAADQGYGGALGFFFAIYYYGLCGVEQSMATAITYKEQQIKREASFFDISFKVLSDVIASIDYDKWEPPSDEDIHALLKLDPKYVHKVIDAAELGYGLAQQTVGLLYLHGISVEKSSEKALYYLEKAATAGMPMASLTVAFLYEEGECVEPSKNDYVKWLLMAAEQGSAFAQKTAGYLYYLGEEVERSDEQAVHWLTRAAENGNAEAQFLVGRFYCDGDIVDRSLEKAVSWYTLAAEQGYAEAQVALAECYEKGKGVPQSDEKAHYWYKNAFENGVESAKEAIDRLEKKSGKLAWLSKRDAFISWNHENVELRERIELFLKEGGLSAWQSDGECTGNITEACMNAIHASRSWIILITKESLKSKWVAEEIEEVFKVIKNDPELKICVIPVFKDRETYALAQQLCKEDPASPFNKIIELGGTYGSIDTTSFYDGKTQGRSDDERIASLVRGALNRRMLIEYRTKCRRKNADFNAFVASRTNSNDSFDDICLKYMLEEAYLPRKISTSKGGTWSETEFIEKLATKKASLLYAEGGAGKSLFLKNLIRTRFAENRYVFSTTAKELAEYLKGNTSKEALLEYFVQDVYACVGYGYKPDLSSIYSLFDLDTNVVFFIVDAVDELGGDAEAMARIREATINAHIATEKNVHFLFTSRNASDGRSLGTDEVYSLQGFTVEDGRRMAKQLFETFKKKLKSQEENPLIDADRLSESDIYVELDKLREDIVGNPLLVTNFVILYFYHVTGGGALPRNEFEIAKESIAFLTRDLESERGVRCDVSDKVLSGLNGILCHLAYKRALGDDHDTGEIISNYIRDKMLDGNQSEADSQANKLMQYLRSRAIVVGGDRVGNVCHAIFRSYLAAHAIYTACYTTDEDVFEEEDIVFKRIEKNGKVVSGKELLAKRKQMFVEQPGAWVDTEVFLVADLDKSIIDLPGVSEQHPLTAAKASYQTLKESLELLYGEPEDATRDAYALLKKMLDAESLYNIAAIKEMLKV